MDNINNQITKYNKTLRLHVLRLNCKELALEAAKQRIDYEEYLLKLMEREQLPQDARDKLQLKL